MALSYCIDLTFEQKAQLLSIARESIQHGLTAKHPLSIDHLQLSGELAELHGSFITLTKRGLLRGCVGAIEATRRLAQSVAINAFNAAFHDRRFSPLSAKEMNQIRIEISVLSRPEPIDIRTRQELLANLRPHEDGLLLKNDGQNATFLPKVWEKLPDPQQFVTQLMTKAGLPGDYWSDSIRFYRYCTISFAEHPTKSAAPFTPPAGDSCRSGFSRD